MDVLWLLLLVGALAALVWPFAIAFGGLTIPSPRTPVGARPAASRDEALARLGELRERDAAEIADACRTRLIEPDGPARATLVLWHGLSNCPAQFGEVAEHLAEKGFRVLLPRIPRHGFRDVLTRELTDLHVEELTVHVNECIDIAAGFGRPVWTAGLSAGAILAGWAAATRPEVSRVAPASPLVAPKGVPMPIVRLLVRFRRWVPSLYIWWDPRKKADLRESPYVYPGFPLPAIVPVLHLGEALYDRRIVPNHRLRRAVLISNPGDFAIRRDAARDFARRAFADHAGSFAELNLDSSLGWWHDFIDPYGPHHGPAGQVAEVFLSALGAADDPTAGGACVAPVPEPDDGDDLDGVVA